MFAVKEAQKYYRAVGCMHRQLCEGIVPFNVTSQTVEGGFVFRSIVTVETSRVIRDDVGGDADGVFTDGLFYFVQRIFDGSGEKVAEAPLLALDKLFLSQLLIARKGVEFTDILESEWLSLFTEIWNSCAPAVLGMLRGDVDDNDVVVSLSSSGGISIPLISRDVKWSSDLVPDTLALMTLVHYIDAKDDIVAALQAQCVDPDIDIKTYLWEWSQAHKVLAKTA